MTIARSLVEFEHHCYLFGEPMTTSLVEGQLGEAALDVFTSGQCHSFAAALGRELGRDLLVILPAYDDRAFHVAVAYGDVKYVDVKGVHALDDSYGTSWTVYARFAAADPGLPGFLDANCAPGGYWHPFVPDLARSFALAAIDRYAL